MDLALSDIISTKTLMATATVATFACLLVWRREHKQSKLPPGPPRDPIIGGLRSMPSCYPWKTLAGWGQRWGDVAFTTVFGSPIIVLNSIEAARNLLDKRSSNYSDRPHAVIRNEIIMWDTISTTHYGDRFRKHRRLISQVLNSQASMAYRDIQVNSTRRLLKSLLESPENFAHHVLRTAYSTIFRVTYGIDVDSDEDALVSLFGETTKRIVQEGSPGFTLIDLFPLLKFVPSWIPGVDFKRRMLETRGYVEKLKNIPFDRLREERKSGVAKPSLLGQLLDDYDASMVVDVNYEYDLKMVGAIMLGAGIETTSAIMETFFQMMAKYPGNVKQAHTQIDAYIHEHRILTLEDRKYIPVVDCIMKEVLRVNPPFPLCIPHAVMDEDEYRGMRIPSGSTIVPNIRYMMEDPRYFSAPHAFNPERFKERTIAIEGDSIKTLNGLDNDDPSAIVFGFGRRICPGRYLADASLWLMMANVLALFHVGPPLDVLGEPRVVGDVEYVDAHTSRPKPFECSITPRNERCRVLIQGLEIDNSV